MSDSCLCPEKNTSPSDALQTYRAKYQAKAMRIEPKNQDEIIQMRIEDGMHDLPSPSPSAPTFEHITEMPTTPETAKKSRYLWAIRPEDVPIALEHCPWGDRLEGKCIKHSNLTGGKEAHSGGELWFFDKDTIIVNANSGRYGATSEDEFSMIIKALMKSGYRVASMGFDIENPGTPNSVLLGEPNWETPA